jgi:hypothetical protein
VVPGGAPGEEGGATGFEVMGVGPGTLTFTWDNTYGLGLALGETEDSYIKPGP